MAFRQSVSAAKNLMNKTKRVALKKHRAKRKKYEQKLKQQRPPSGSLPRR